MNAEAILEVARLAMQIFLQAMKMTGATDADIKCFYAEERAKFEARKPEDLT